MLLALVLALGVSDATASPTTILVESDSVRVRCPVGVTTRVVVPDLKRRVTVTSDAHMRVDGTSTAAAAELAIRPEAPGRALVDFEGETIRLHIEVEAITVGGAATDVEIRLQLPGATTIGETPPPKVASEVAPKPRIIDVAFPDDDATAAGTTPAVISPRPAAPPPGLEPPHSNPAADQAPSGASRDLTATGLVDIEDLVGAKPERLSRRVTIAGHPDLLAETLHLGTRWTWAQLRLRGGASRAVASLTWRRAKQTGPVAHWRAAPDGKDLRLTLQIPRGEGRLVVTVQVLGGARYDVPLTRPGLADIKDRLF